MIGGIQGIRRPAPAAGLGQGDAGKGTGVMKISSRGRYALRASLALARIGGEGAPAPIERIAEQEAIPSLLLDQLFFKLRKAGIVASVRGADGGVYFVRPPEKLTVKELLDAVGEDLDLADCGKQEAEECPPPGERLARGVWAGLTDMINGYLGGITLGALLEKERPEGK
jgi:Rrf2 family iron-sulfur cluster assembly transcriptional regulator